MADAHNAFGRRSDAWQGGIGRVREYWLVKQLRQLPGPVPSLLLLLEAPEEEVGGGCQSHHDVLLIVPQAAAGNAKEQEVLGFPQSGSIKNRLKLWGIYCMYESGFFSSSPLEVVRLRPAGRGAGRVRRREKRKGAGGKNKSIESDTFEISSAALEHGQFNFVHRTLPSQNRSYYCCRHKLTITGSNCSLLLTAPKNIIILFAGFPMQRR